MNIRRRTQINISILVISAMLWMVLLVNPGSIMTISHCPVTDSGASAASLQMLLAMNPVSSLLTGWALMLAAMMSPMLIAPIHHIRERSFKRRRVRSVLLFITGYAAIWMAAGSVLLATTIALNLFAPQSYLPIVAIGVIALVWQCSPLKQRCINRHHNHRALAAFGAAADIDALRFGITHGAWCVASCWALMLLPMLFSSGHFVVMAIVTYVMISERLEHPKSPSWHFRFSGKLAKILIAQSRIQLKNIPVFSRNYSSEINR